MSGLISADSGWIYIIIIFAGGILYLMLMQRMEASRILKKFERASILLTSFGVNFYGLQSEPGGPERSIGTLVLVQDGLFYRARHSRREIFLPGGAITHIEVIDEHKGKLLHQKVIGIAFINKEASPDMAAFRIPNPARWVSLLKNRFLTGK